MNIRWLTPKDPAYFETLNRPTADVTLRTLILAKSLDQLYGSLGHQSLYPFLVQPRVRSGASIVDLPPNWIWSIQITVPRKWERIRLAKIRRVAGVNTGEYTGYLQLMFTGSTPGTNAETVLFLADYQIDSALTYQVQQLRVPTPAEESGAIGLDEAQTITGSITFRTLDPAQIQNSTLLDALSPPNPPLDSDGDGFYDSPPAYELADTPALSSSGASYNPAVVTHGTGMLNDSVRVGLPHLESDIQGWLNSFNYPYDAIANRTSTAGITIPVGLFREFNVCAPAGDEASGDPSSERYPVWLSRIEQVETNRLRLFLSTYGLSDSETPNPDPVEFASFELLRTNAPGEIIAIEPAANLIGQPGEAYGQHFGRGHAVLSAVWADSEVMTEFFATFASILDNPKDTDFSQASTRLSAFAVSRVPRYSPSAGQAAAMLGSTAKRAAPLDPGQDNRYVTEQDQGLGNQVDLDAIPNVQQHAAIERYGFSGGLCHRVIKLVVDGTKVGDADDFYERVLAPRFRALLGRDPVFGDVWYDGTSFRTYNGQTWQD